MTEINNTEPMNPQDYEFAEGHRIGYEAGLRAGSLPDGDGMAEHYGYPRHHVWIVFFWRRVGYATGIEFSVPNAEVRDGGHMASSITGDAPPPFSAPSCSRLPESPRNIEPTNE
jgi:hypothetical protein